MALTFIRGLLKRSKKKTVLKEQNVQLSVIDAFSGDDRYDTELDLAKAYLELQEYEKVKHLLKSVITHGSSSQILIARHMFSQLLKKERL